MLLEKNDTLLFIGDSISDYERKRPVGEGLFNALGHSYVACAGALLNCMYPELHLRVINMGVSGNQVRDLDARWQTDVMDLKPQWVSVLIGINDVWRQFDSPAITDSHVLPDEYEKNVEEMIGRINGKVKGIFILSPYIIEPNRQDMMRSRMDEYVEISRKLAEKYHCIFVNFQKMYEDYCKIRHSSYIAWDRIHPNQIGATLMAKEFLSKCGFDDHR